MKTFSGGGGGGVEKSDNMVVDPGITEGYISIYSLGRSVIIHEFNMFTYICISWYNCIILTTELTSMFV